MTRDQETAIGIIIGHLRSEDVPQEDWTEMIHDHLRDTPYKVNRDEIETYIEKHRSVLNKLPRTIQDQDSLQ